MELDIDGAPSSTGRFQDLDNPNERFLALKYGSIWQERVLKGRRLENDCPVRVARVKHENGEVDVFPGAAFKILAPGCQLFTDSEAQLQELHPALPQYVHFHLPANPRDWGVSMDDHIALNFRTHARAFLLLPVQMAEPR